ncbi:MAG: pyridoxamine 5'-phosphate oxidase family protein [Myxococcales bacterium]|nr:pyridoxamine 5'-phosphate oxidase family protein [Myxococcales bacterium]
MGPTKTYPSDIAFSPAVKEVQRRQGSRAAYARLEKSGGWNTAIDAALGAFIADQTSFFLATANAEGQPYIQHRGGPPGFLRVIDEHTLGFADFRGNRQYISVGNLSENPKVNLFLIDYEERSRVKIWGEARVVEDDPALLASLKVEGYKATIERAIVIDVCAWDANCPQHIPQRFDAEDVARMLARKDETIAELEAQLRALRKRS